MSKRSARDKHPFIEDAELEESQTTYEKIGDALLLALQQKVESGQARPEAVAQVLKLIKQGEMMEDAIISVGEQEAARQAKMQADQQAQMAAQAQGGAPGGGPGGAPGGPPDTGGLGGEAGLRAALAGAEQPPAAPQQKNLADLIKTVAAPSRFGTPGSQAGASPTNG